MERILGMKLFTKRLSFGQFKDLSFLKWCLPLGRNLRGTPLFHYKTSALPLSLCYPILPKPCLSFCFCFLFSSPWTSYQELERDYFVKAYSLMFIFCCMNNFTCSWKLSWTRWRRKYRTTFTDVQPKLRRWQRKFKKRLITWILWKEKQQRFWRYCLLSCLVNYIAEDDFENLRQ